MNARAANRDLFFQVGSVTRTREQSANKGVKLLSQAPMARVEAQFGREKRILVLGATLSALFVAETLLLKPLFALDFGERTYEVRHLGNGCWNKAIWRFGLRRADAGAKKRQPFARLCTLEENWESKANSSFCRRASCLLSCSNRAAVSAIGSCLGEGIARVGI